VLGSILDLALHLFSVATVGFPLAIGFGISLVEDEGE
jgi:hypothetical protein